MSDRDDITVSKKCPLLVNKGDDANYGEVCILPGGYIQIAGDAVFDAEILYLDDPSSGDGAVDESIECDSHDAAANYASLEGAQLIIMPKNPKKAVEGIRGIDGGNGGNGYIGGNGGSGGDGTDGGDGMDGKDGATATIIIRDLRSDIVVVNAGGKAGDGGDGGDGGNGGNGGGSAFGQRGGDGGNGGNGKNGGNGGNGGKGGHVDIYYLTSNQSVITGVNMPGRGGRAGKGGQPGKGGLAGKSGRADKDSLTGESDGGESGDSGIDGIAGKDGVPGTDGSPGALAMISGLPAPKTPDSELPAPKTPDSELPAPKTPDPELLASDSHASEAPPLPKSEFKSIRLNREDTLGASHKILNGRQQVRLDFSMPSHEEYFLRTHGGEELLKKKYKAVYQAFVRTKEKQSNQCAKGAGDSSPNVASNISPISAVVGFPNVRYTNGAYKIFNSAYAYANTAIDYVSMSGFMIDPVTKFSYGAIWNEFDKNEISQRKYKCVESMERAFNGANQKKNVQTYCEFLYAANVLPELNSIIRQSDAVFDNNAVEAIARIEIKAPRSYKGYNPIRVTYKRYGIDSDYDYPNNAPSGGKIKTLMPIEGSITFKPPYKPMKFSQKETLPIELVYETKNTVEYGYSLAEIAAFFSIDRANPQKVNFKFNDDWKVGLPVSSYTGDMIIDLSCPFYYAAQKEGQTNLSHIPISISSDPSAGKFYESENSVNVYIPSIKLLWDCFGKDTYITMEGGREKLVSDIKPKDRVAVYRGRYAEVRQVLCGTEQTMVRIEAENNRHIFVTANHPLLTARGVVRAYDIHVADKLILGDGSQKQIKCLYVAEYNDKIYQLDLGGGHMIIANGFVTGDMDAQSDLERKQKETERLSPEMEEFIGEMKMLREELKKDFI